MSGFAQYKANKIQRNDDPGEAFRSSILSLLPHHALKQERLLVHLGFGLFSGGI